MRNAKAFCACGNALQIWCVEILKHINRCHIKKKKKGSFPDSSDTERRRDICSGSSCVVTDPGSELRGDSSAHQAHIPNRVFLRGLVPNLINCENVVGGMSQLSAAPQSIPEEGLVVLSPSAFPSVLPNLKLLNILTHCAQLLLAAPSHCCRSHTRLQLMASFPH